MYFVNTHTMTRIYPLDTEFFPRAPLFNNNFTGPSMSRKMGEELSRREKNLGLPTGGEKVCTIFAFLRHLTQFFRRGLITFLT